MWKCCTVLISFGLTIGLSSSPGKMYPAFNHSKIRFLVDKITSPVKMENVKDIATFFLSHT